jgi:Helix-hairpin-helix motif
MLKIKNPIRRLLDRLQNRFARSRPGSVLVLVVALLVLMALIGTAYITTARTDRFSAQQNALNTQIDLLLQGVINMAEASMTTSAHQQMGGQHWDDTRTDTWLSSRIPGGLAEACGAYVVGHSYAKGDCLLEPFNTSGSIYVSLIDNNTTSPPGATWGVIGTYANVGTVPAWAALSSPLATSANIEDPSTGFIYQSQHSGQAAIVAMPTSTKIAGKLYPALQFFDFNTGKVQTVLAASASGDGIADSFLWRLPIGEINGVTYYAAVRIIDNNAAINLNTAFCSTVDFDGQGKALTTLAGSKLSFGIFTGNIGLAEMLKTTNLTSGAITDQTLGAEIWTLNNYRYFGTLPLNPPPNPPRPSGIGATTPPPDEYGAPRNDFFYNTVEEALYMGLGRRVNNPGYSNPTPLAARYQSLSWGDAAALAYKFDLVNANSSPTTSEQCLTQSLYNDVDSSPLNIQRTNGYRTGPYIPSDVLNWYATFHPQAQQFGSPIAPIAINDPYCLRPFVITRNPLNNLMPGQNLNLGNYQQLMGSFDPTLGTGPRVSLNTANVLANDYPAPINAVPQSLWLGFYNAMYPAVDPNNPALNPALPGQGQFRSSLRDVVGVYPSVTTFFNPLQQVQLRSLIAAINAKDLRDSDDNVDSRTVQMQATISSQAFQPVNVTVFGNERQVYITEVYANNDNSIQPDKLPKDDGTPSDVDNPNKTKFNPKGYVAIELHNPYSTDIYITGWQLGIMNRSASDPINPYPKMAMTGISTFNGFDGTVKVPANGYVVLENYQATPTNNDAQYRPFTSYAGYNAQANPNYIYVPNLHEVFHDPSTMKPGGELYLLRPRNANGVLQGNEKDQKGLPVLAAMVPADAFDFAGTLGDVPAMGATQFAVMHYVRANGTFAGPNGAPAINNLWRFVYPGRWTPAGHQEGVIVFRWDTGTPGKDSFDNWIVLPPGGAPPAAGQPPASPPPNDGSAGAMGAPINLGYPDPAPSYPNRFPAIQLNNTDFGGPNKSFGPKNSFPYGGFARVGDVLQVPFIGAYTVTLPPKDQNSPPIIVEMNCVTTDSAFADDNDNGADDPIEQIGRFCPLAAADPLNKFFNPAHAQVVSILPKTLPVPPAPPIILDPYGWAANILDCFTTIQNPNDDYTPNVDPYTYSLNFPVPTNVPNFATLNETTANRRTEDLAPIEGLINVNTAPFAVLRRVPFTVTPTTNDQIAQAIIQYRNVNGPFRTLFDLNNVPLFWNPTGGDMTLMASSYDTGDLSTVGPGSIASDGVVNDFEKRFMSMTRVSNLLTTRSDTYTAYILVQGWRGVGTTNPEMVVQRRAAFIADRSGVTASNRSLNIINVQAN